MSLCDVSTFFIFQLKRVHLLFPFSLSLSLFFFFRLLGVFTPRQLLSLLFSLSLSLSLSLSFTSFCNTHSAMAASVCHFLSVCCCVTNSLSRVHRRSRARTFPARSRTLRVPAVRVPQKALPLPASTAKPRMPQRPQTAVAAAALAAAVPAVPLKTLRRQAQTRAARTRPLRAQAASRRGPLRRLRAPPRPLDTASRTARALRQRRALLSTAPSAVQLFLATTLLPPPPPAAAVPAVLAVTCKTAAAAAAAAV